MSKKLIDKDALVAKINNWIKDARTRYTLSKAQFSLSDRIESLENLLSYLDTLEEKEGDFGNSMVCKVDWYDGFLLDYTQEQQDKLLEKIGVNVGDKVRIILIKE